MATRASRAQEQRPPHGKDPPVAAPLFAKYLRLAIDRAAAPISIFYARYGAVGKHRRIVRPVRRIWDDSGP